MQAVLNRTVTKLRCWCCGLVHDKRDSTTDPYEGRMDGYCDECSLHRCDAFPGECPNDLNRL